MPRCFKMSPDNDRVIFDTPISIVGDATVTCWIKFDSINIDDDGNIVGDQANNNYWRLAFGASHIVFLQPGSLAGVTPTEGNFSAGVWYFLAFVIDSTVYRLYRGLEGSAPVTDGTATGQTPGTWEAEQIGADNTSVAGDSMDCKIGDLRFYEAALSLADLTTIWEGGQVSEPLYRWYKCDRTHATIAFDSSPNEIDAVKTDVDLNTFHFEGDDVPFDYPPGPSPSTIPEIDTWYDPTDNDEITEANGLVEFWNNKISGTTPILGQLTESNRPNINNGMGPNGLQCMTFNGAATQYLLVPDNFTTRSKPFEIWLAVQITSNLGVLRQDIMDGDGVRLRVWLDDSGVLRVANAAGQILLFGAWPTDGKPHVLRILAKDSPNASVTLDDGTPVTGNIGTDDFAGMQLGTNIAESFPLYGKIGDVLLVDDELTGNDLSGMWDFTSRWTKATPKGGFGVGSGLGISI